MLPPGDLCAGQPETALAVGIVVQCLLQDGGVHVRPQRIGEPQFGIRQLPQQEVTDANFTPGADQQVQRRQVRQAGMRMQYRFINRRYVQVPFTDALRQGASSFGNIPATAIISGDNQCGFTPRSEFLSGGDSFLNGGSSAQHCYNAII